MRKFFNRLIIIFFEYRSDIFIKINNDHILIIILSQMQNI